MWPGLGHTGKMEPLDIYAPPTEPPVIDKSVATEARKFLTTALAEYRRLGVIPSVRRLNRLNRTDIGGDSIPWRKIESSGHSRAARSGRRERDGRLRGCPLQRAAGLHRHDSDRMPPPASLPERTPQVHAEWIGGRIGCGRLGS